MSLGAGVGDIPPTIPTPIASTAMAAVLGGRYEIGSRLGGGGAATVYAARDLVLGRAVAVKVMRNDGEADQAERFEQEARLLAGLSHPGLVTVYDAGSDVDDRGDPQAYLVMELVDGSTLARRLADGPMSMQQTADIGRQLATALGYVHDQGIVHRDVKPANVLLSQARGDHSATARLTDFGIARPVAGERMTMQGFTVGTANYLSPEQAMGEDVGAPADVYSLGLVLLECLTGVMAYPGNGVAAASARLHRQPAIPNRLGTPWVSLLEAMTRRDPARRIAAGEAAAELARLRAVEAPVAQTRVLPALSAQTRGGGQQRRRGWLLAGAAAVALFVVALVAALALGPIGPPKGVHPAVGRSTAPATTAVTTSGASNPQGVVVRSTTAHPKSTPTPARPAGHVPAPHPPKKPKHGGHGG